jgi:hypothetical protein
MGIRQQLRKLPRSHRGRRWTIREKANGQITEIKMIFNPEEYGQYKNAKQMYTDKRLLKLLDKDYERFISNSGQ